MPGGNENVMLSIPKTDGSVVEFREVYDPVGVFLASASPAEKEAWCVAFNVRIGLRENESKLGPDELSVLYWGLFEKFASLGIPGGLLLPLVSAFKAVQDAQDAKREAKG
jgi:hypothetical protein